MKDGIGLYNQLIIPNAPCSMPGHAWSVSIHTVGKLRGNDKQLPHMNTHEAFGHDDTLRFHSIKCFCEQKDKDQGHSTERPETLGALILVM